MTKLGVIFIGITALFLIACSQEQQREYSKQMATYNLPKGAVLIEQVPSTKSTGMYTIFKFKEQCFLKHDGGHHVESMANIECPR